MSKKILTVLAPVLAITAFMVLPAMAQATQAQCGGVECANGQVIKGQSTNLVTQTSAGNLQCNHSEFEGTITSNQGTHVTGSVTKDILSNCMIGSTTIDVKTNASAAAPWTLQVQQPEHQGTGAEQHEQITSHLEPASGSVIQFTVQPQVFGFSVTTCDYSASGIQLMGEVGSNESTVTGTNQFTRQSGSAELCGTPGTLDGSFTLKDHTGAAVTIDMT